LIALVVDGATRMYVYRRVSKLSLAMLAFYLIAFSALVADIHLRANGCPVTIRIADSLLPAGGTDCEQAAQ
jgi:hypothetical protein